MVFNSSDVYLSSSNKESSIQWMFIEKLLFMICHYFLAKNPTAQHGNTTVRGAIIIESFYPYHNTLPFISTFQSFFNPPVDSQ